MKKLSLLVASILLSSASYGDAIEAIGSVGYSDSGDINTTTINLLHYAEARETLGPLDQFSFINENSFISASLSNSDFVDSYGLQGTLYTDSGFFVGASYLNADFDFSDVPADSFFEDDIDTTTATLGYQGIKNWSFSATYVDSENLDSQVNFNVRYNHELGGNDYVGFDLSTNDETDFISLSSTYFASLGDSRYMVLRANYTDLDGGSDAWSVGGDYYFTERTSVGAIIGDDDLYGITAKHFFTRNVGLSLSYSDSDLADDGTFAAGLIGQF